MTTKYSKDFELPSELPNILRDLTKEILRCQPKDINLFALQYFEKKTALKSKNMGISGVDQAANAVIASSDESIELTSPQVRKS